MNDPKIQEDNRKRAASRAEFAAKQADPKSPRNVLYRCFDELRSNKIEIGMSADQVRAAICLGANSQPWHVNVTKTAAGRQEQWVYQDPPDGHVFGYLYFEGGVLVGIQTR